MTDQPTTADLIAAVQAAINSDPALSQTSVAAALDCSPSVLSQWLRGIYKGDNEGVTLAVQQWLALRAEGAAVARAMPDDMPWYSTETAERIWTRLRLAHHAPDICVIDGAAGVGKTCTARHYADSYPGVWHATMSPDCAGVATALEEISEAMELEVTGGAAAHRRAILKRIKAAGGAALLIIDEAQHLGVAALDEVRTLHDRAGCGIAYLGNAGIWSQLVGGGRRGIALDRLHSRVGARAHCQGATTKDVQALLSAWGITDRGARSVVTEIARRPGALRAATKTIRSAHLYAQGGAINAEHLRAARVGRGL